MIETHRLKLTFVVNEPENNRVFGYALTESQEPVYIPGKIISSMNITEDDVNGGASITSRLGDNTKFVSPESDSPRLIAVPPVSRATDVERDTVTQRLDKIVEAMVAGDDATAIRLTRELRQWVSAD